MTDNTPQVFTPTSPPLDDLVAQAAKGNRGAFDQVMNRTYRLVRKVAAPLLPPSAVDDAVQETYLIVLKKLSHLKEPAAFRGWLTRIALHVCYEWRRKSKPSEELRAEHAVTEVESSKVDVRAALEQLKERDRNILILREFLGLNYEEIADVLRLKEGTVRSRLFYARGRLKDILAPPPIPLTPQDQHQQRTERARTWFGKPSRPPT